MRLQVAGFFRRVRVVFALLLRQREKSRAPSTTTPGPTSTQGRTRQPALKARKTTVTTYTTPATPLMSATAVLQAPLINGT